MNLEEAITLLRSTAPITVADRATVAAELERVSMVLVEMETCVHFSPRDRSGETSTRKVQKLAAVALRGVAR